MIDVPIDKNLEKLTQLSEKFKQTTDEYERSRLANEQLCLLENVTLAARRYCSTFLKPTGHHYAQHILPYCT